MAVGQSSTDRIQTGDRQYEGEENETDTYLYDDEEEESIYVASPLQMMWWRFIKHKMAIVGGVIVILLYLVAISAEFLAPYNLDTYEVALTYAPPQKIHFFHNEEFQGGPFVYGLTQARNSETLRMEFQTDESVRYPVQFWVEGDAYKFWGLFKSNHHLFGININEPVIDADGESEVELLPFATVFVLGADKLGRDMLTRIIYGSRISLSIGLIGVALSFLFGVVLGGISGYYGGVINVLIHARSSSSAPCPPSPCGWP